MLGYGRWITEIDANKVLMLPLQPLHGQAWIVTVMGYAMEPQVTDRVLVVECSTWSYGAGAG